MWALVFSESSVKHFIFISLCLLSFSIFAKQFIYSDIYGSEVLINIEETSKECKIKYKGGHVTHSTTSCGWKLASDIKVFGQGLKLELTLDNLQHGNRNWTTPYGEYFVREINDITILSNKFDKLFLIEYKQMTPFPAIHLTLFSPESGVVAFGRRTESYDKLHISGLNFINGTCGFAGNCNEN